MITAGRSHRRSIIPLAAAAPHTNRSESPGRKGRMTKPVSKKMIKKMIKYVHIPY
jgi:hypothetical protein